MRVAALSLVVARAAAIEPEDVPTFRFSCRVTSSAVDAPAPPPPQRPYPEPPCTLNATACPTEYTSFRTCHGSTCLAANYSFSLGCPWFTPCTATTGVETSSGAPSCLSPTPPHSATQPDTLARAVGSAWSAWSAEYNITMAQQSLAARQGFYRKYPVLGVELGVRSARKGKDILNLSCALRFTGRDQQQSAATIHASFQNNNDTTGQSSNPAAFTGFVGLMLGRDGNNRSQVRT